MTVTEPGISIMTFGIGDVADGERTGDIALREDDEDIRLLSSPESVIAFISEDVFTKYRSKGVMQASNFPTGGRVSLGLNGFFESPMMKVEISPNNNLNKNAYGYVFKMWGSDPKFNARDREKAGYIISQKEYLVFKIEVNGGYKSSIDSQEFIDKSEVSEGGIYIIEFRKINYFPQQSEQVYKVYQNYNEAGVPADNVWHYDLDGEIATCEKNVSEIIVKNNKLPDSKYKFIRRTLLKGDRLRTWDVIRFRLYGVDSSRDLKENSGQTLNLSKFRYHDIKIYERYDNIYATGSFSKISEEKTSYFLEQGIGEIGYAGKVKSHLSSKGELTVYEPDPIGKKEIGRKYTVLNPKKVKNLDGERPIEIKDLDGLDVVTTEYFYDNDGKTLRLEEVNSGKVRLAHKNAREALGSKGYALSINNARMEFRREYSAKYEEISGRKFKKSDVSTNSSKIVNANLSASNISTQTASSSQELTETSQGLFTITEEREVGFNLNGFLSGSAPNYSDVPSIVSGGGYDAKLTLTVRESPDVNVITLPWGDNIISSEYTVLVDSQSELNVVISQYGEKLYSCRYIYINGAFHLADWAYAHRHISGSYYWVTDKYYSNGTFSLESYNTSTSVKTSVGIDGSVTETYDNYTLKKGVDDAIYGKQYSILKIDYGSHETLFGCGCNNEGALGSGSNVKSFYSCENINTGMTSILPNIGTAEYQTAKIATIDGVNNVLTEIKLNEYGVSQQRVVLDPYAENKVIKEIAPGYSESSPSITTVFTDEYNYVKTGPAVVSEYTSGYLNDNYNRVTRTTYGALDSGRFYEKTYDYNSNLIKEENAFGVVTYSFLSQDKPNFSSYPDGTAICYEYDNYQNLTKIVHKYGQCEISSLAAETKQYEILDSQIWEVKFSNGVVEKTRLTGYGTATSSGENIFFESIAQKDQKKVLIQHSVNRNEKTVSETKSVLDQNSTKSHTTFEKFLNGLLVAAWEADIENPFGSNPVKRYISSYIYEYDNIGRLWKRYSGLSRTSAGSITTYYYYPNQLTTINVSGNNLSYRSVGRLKSIITETGSGVKNGIMYEYYPDNSVDSGKIKKLTYGRNFYTDATMTGPSVHFQYNSLGLVTHVWGLLDTPAILEYDILGQNTDLYIFKAPHSDTLWNTDVWPSSVTKSGIPNGSVEHINWVYDTPTGNILSKTDALGNVRTNTFSAIGDLISSVDESGRLTTFSQSYITDSETLKAIKTKVKTFGGVDTVYKYTSDDAVKSVSIGDKNWSYEYDSILNPSLSTSEIYPDGHVLERDINSYGDVEKLTLKNPEGEVIYEAFYSSEVDGKIKSVSCGNNVSTYTRSNNGAYSISNTTESGTISFNYVSDSFGRINLWTSPDLQINYTFDTLGRLINAKYGRNTSTPLYNWAYSYLNNLSALSSAKMYSGESQLETDLIPYASEEYRYDSAGNLLEKKAANVELLWDAYSSNIGNALLQINKAADSQYVVSGSTDASASLSVFVDGESKTISRSSADFTLLLPAFSETAKYLHIKTESMLAGAGHDGVDAKSMKFGSFYISPTPEALTYDANGNLTSDSRWVYAWDYEDRLISATTKSEVISSGVPNLRFEYGYDWMGRKISTKEYRKIAENSTWELLSVNTRFYDNWNLIYEKTVYTDVNKSPDVKKYYYGEDILYSNYETGGTGALRIIDINGKCAYVFSNMIGSIEALYSAKDGSLIGRYEYSPFGEVRQIRSCATDNEYVNFAEQNPLRYSTRYHEVTLNLHYYGYRHYSPRMQKWLSKEPLGEFASANLYSFVMNSPVTYFDKLGLNTYGLTKTGSAYFHSAGATAQATNCLGFAMSGGALDSNGDSPYMYNWPSDRGDKNRSVSDDAAALGWMCTIASNGASGCDCGDITAYERMVIYEYQNEGNPGDDFANPNSKNDLHGIYSPTGRGDNYFQVPTTVSKPFKPQKIGAKRADADYGKNAFCCCRCKS